MYRLRHSGPICAAASCVCLFLVFLECRCKLSVRFWFTFYTQSHRNITSCSSADPQIECWCFLLRDAERLGRARIVRWSRKWQFTQQMQRNSALSLTWWDDEKLLDFFSEDLKWIRVINDNHELSHLYYKIAASFRIDKSNSICWLIIFLCLFNFKCLECLRARDRFSWFLRILCKNWTIARLSCFVNFPTTIEIDEKKAKGHRRR